MRDSADDELAVAGLLHDFGDGRVSESARTPWAAALVRSLLGERVAWLIGACAEAKRFLYATEPAYWATLAPVSQPTLEQQGGRLTPAEVERFAAHAWSDGAVLLRRCDDTGKKAGYTPTEPERFHALLKRVAQRTATGQQLG